LIFALDRTLYILELDPSQKYRVAILVELKFDPKLVSFLSALVSMIFVVASDEFVQLYLIDNGECKPIQMI
jgi:hypothetical protein